MRFKEVLSELFYPSGIRCVVCGDELPRTTRYSVCEKCELSFNTRFCSRCGRAMENMADFCEHCKSKSGHEEYFDKARAPFVYENHVVDLVHRLKFGGGKYLCETMAQFMADTYVECGLTADVVTFVPMHPKRKRARGYNQAEVLALKTAELIGLPCEELLTRVKNTSALAKMKSADRSKEIVDAFSLNGEQKLSEKRVLLIDDVFTSGATSNECARMLKKAKADEVIILTFATSKIRIDLPQKCKNS